MFDRPGRWPGPCAPASCAPTPRRPAAPPGKTPDPSAGAAFLAKMAKDPSVHTLPDGLEYKIVHSGPADRPTAEARRRGEGQLRGHPASTARCSTAPTSKGEPASSPWASLIPGWNEALQLMRPGDDWYLYIPAKLGYGDQGAGPIPPGSVLVFKVELLGVLPHGGGAQG